MASQHKKGASAFANAPSGRNINNFLREPRSSFSDGRKQGRPQGP